jgi:hypothetical protein
MSTSTTIPAGNVDDKINYWRQLILDLEAKRAAIVRVSLKLRQIDGARSYDFAIMVSVLAFLICTLAGLIITVLSRTASFAPLIAGIAIGLTVSAVAFLIEYTKTTVEDTDPQEPMLETKEVDAAIHEAYQRLEFWQHWKSMPPEQTPQLVPDFTTTKVRAEEDYPDHPFGSMVVPAGTIAEKIQAWSDLLRELEDERTAIAIEFSSRANRSDRYRFPRGYLRSILLASSCAVGLAIMGVLYLDSPRPLQLDDYAVFGVIAVIVVGFFSFEYSANSKAVRYYREFPVEGKFVDAAIDRVNARIAFWERQAARPPAPVRTPNDHAAARAALVKDENLDHPSLTDADIQKLLPRRSVVSDLDAIFQGLLAVAGIALLMWIRFWSRTWW